MAKAPYSLSFQIGEDKQTTKGVDVLSCLQKIKEPKEYKGMGHFVLTKDNHSSIARMPALKLKQLFARDIDKALFAKRLTILL